jgi:hypothetical protein
MVGVERRHVVAPSARPENGKRPPLASASTLRVSDRCSRERPLDLGAGPGGRTRILRCRGLEMWAVDPGELAARSARPPRCYDRGALVRLPEPTVDLVVNDMRIEAALSAQVTADAADNLRQEVSY